MSEIKLNVSVPKKLGINAGPTQLLSGATFIPNVDAEGNISWTNDKGLENPQTQNIMGPQGKEGPPGPQGEPGATYELPIATSEVLGGVKIGEGLEIDSLTGVLNATGGSGITVINATPETPVDLDDLKEPGIYFIQATKISDLKNYPTNLAYLKFLLFIYDGAKSYPSNIMPAQIIFMPSGSQINGQYQEMSIIHRETAFNATRYSSWKINTIGDGTDVYTIASNNLFNGKGANNMYKELTGYTGKTALSSLQTTDKTSLVNAINELKSRIDNLESN